MLANCQQQQTYECECDLSVSERYHCDAAALHTCAQVEACTYVRPRRQNRLSPLQPSPSSLLTAIGFCNFNCTTLQSTTYLAALFYFVSLCMCARVPPQDAFVLLVGGGHACYRTDVLNGGLEKHGTQLTTQCYTSRRQFQPETVHDRCSRLRTTAQYLPFFIQTKRESQRFYLSSCNGQCQG